MRLADAVGRWIGRVELVLGGAEIPLREGEEAIAAGDWSRARGAAHEILARVPGSPLGLALLADACEGAGLDAERAMALEELAQRAPSRGDVWVRLARAREATGAKTDDVRDALVRALGVAEPGSDARREALLALADLDLAQGEPERAELWLERVAGDRGADAAVRRAEARAARGDADGALAALSGVTIDATDARANLALGRAQAWKRSPDAIAPLLRAFILDAPGASDALSSAIAWIAADDATRARVRTVVDAHGEAGLARWRAAFARAEGRRDEARAALVEATRAGESGAARPLLESAMEDRDEEALAAAVHALERAPDDPALRDARRLTARGAIDPGSPAMLDELAALVTPAARAWADAIRRDVARAWIPPREPARWPIVLARLEPIARALHDLDASARIAALSAERRRPLRLAIVGEFNAGKSTFINALVGAEIAPTGVLPTTATLHHLRYAPDPIARVLFVAGHEPPERIVPVGELRAVLKSIDARSLRRVEILMPLPTLTRVEILDTPGFNAPDSSHAEAARGAFDEADAAIWLLDAGQPMKRTEREVLAEAKAARVPVQVLVNKADRLAAPGVDHAAVRAGAPSDRDRVLAAVTEGLAESGLASWTTPLLFSARRALAGKLGDAAALADSGWGEVDAMLEAQFVARSDELKERALRRRALAIVAMLGREAAQAADAERADDQRRRDRAEAIARAAARIDRDAETVAARVAEGLARGAQAWGAELAIVSAGRAQGGLAGDASLQRYKVDRALAHLARPLAHALAGVVDGTGLAPSDVTPLARASIRAFASAFDHAARASRADVPSVSPDATSLTPLARSAVASLVEHLVALAASPAPAPRAAGVVGELTALAEALSA